MKHEFTINLKHNNIKVESNRFVLLFSTPSFYCSPHLYLLNICSTFRYIGEIVDIMNFSTKY